MKLKVVIKLSFLFCLFFARTVFCENISEVELIRLTDKVMIHRSYYDIGSGTIYPANGLIILGSDSLIMVDTPWTNEQTRNLIKLLSDNFHRKISLALFTHAHNDRIGGISTLISEGIPGMANLATCFRAFKDGYSVPELLDFDHKINLDQIRIEYFFPGAGHTPDNSVVWLPNEKILFGGCFIKSYDSKSLGNLAEANVSEWQVSLRRIVKKFPKAEIVVPGHGDPGGKELIDHTLQLSREYLSKSE
ncbi:MAG: subclass B1 metallo-beta-lactamase [Candidatus Riflebacteria bacterium]|nr:subclass B1 metallo-beta-lactamase [Candidatus Riflebacteria bacterium]